MEFRKVGPFGIKMGRVALSALIGLSVMLPLSASAQSRLEVLRQHNQRQEWKSRLDETIKGLDDFRSTQPTLSVDTVTYLERSIQDYRGIVSKGGWAAVPSPRNKIRMGARDKVVIALRQRLIASGDIDAGTGSSATFDSDVDEGVRRFQVRHGLTLGELMRIASDLMPGIPRLLAVNKIRPGQTPDKVYETFGPLVRGHGRYYIQITRK